MSHSNEVQGVFDDYTAFTGKKVSSDVVDDIVGFLDEFYVWNNTFYAIRVPDNDILDTANQVLRDSSRPWSERVNELKTPREDGWQLQLLFADRADCVYGAEHAAALPLMKANVIRANIAFIQSELDLDKRFNHLISMPDGSTVLCDEKDIFDYVTVPDDTFQRSLGEVEEPWRIAEIKIAHFWTTEDAPDYELEPIADSYEMEGYGEATTGVFSRASVEEYCADSDVSLPDVGENGFYFYWGRDAMACGDGEWYYWF